MKRLAIALLLVLAVVIVSPAVPVHAIADPDTAPAVNAVYVYEFEDGSTGVLVDYYLDYASLPSETVTEAYLVVFVDTDGTTQLKSVAPYTFTDSGYGRGLAWIMFTEAETVSYGLDSTLSGDYEIWLTGNPTVASGWTGDPPKTIATIDQWNTTGDMQVLLALRVLYYADTLELAWSLDLVESTAAGNRLTTLGESYFVNVISDLRTLAPAVFPNVEITPTLIPLDYSTAFSATASNGTATVDGSPVTLTEGNNTITVNSTGTILITLSAWATGNVTDDTGTLTGSPADVDPGVNTLTVTAIGDFTVSLAAIDTISLAEGDVTGTGFDLTGLATAFGTTRWMMSGLIWTLITILVCAAVYKIGSDSSGLGGDSTAGQSVTLTFSLMIVGGWLLHLLHPVVLAVLLIGSGAATGYFLFFKSETLHKGFMFMMWMFLIVSLAGNMAAGGTTGITATYLTADVSATETNTINVASTTGFPPSGVLFIDGEHIGYPRKTTTAFESTKALLVVTTNPLLRGLNDTTDNVTHLSGTTVRTIEAGIFNSSIDYKVAKLTDSAGTLGFLSFPADLLNLIVTFFVLPLSFLGTELFILTYVWAVVAIGMIVGFVLQLAGGRRV